MIEREKPIMKNLGEGLRWPGRVAGEPANLDLIAETYKPLGEPIAYGGLADALIILFAHLLLQPSVTGDLHL